ncbi:MAG: NUDIX domain-containing protein [Rikenellaceae bacterium]
MESCKQLESFTFCPKCGGNFVDNNIKSKQCTACGFTYYFNPSAAVVAIIKNEAGEILVATRAKEPAKGSFDLPGGFVDCFESAEQSICREVMEECNLEVKSLKYLFSIPNIYSYSNFNVHTVDTFFECQVESFEGMVAADDVAELQFIAPSKLDPSKFGLKSISTGVMRYLATITELLCLLLETPIKK